MPTSQEHQKLRILMKHSLDTFQGKSVRLFNWEFTIIFYQAVHLIEQFRNDYITKKLFLSEHNSSLLKSHSMTHSQCRAFLLELKRLGVISPEFNSRYLLLENTSMIARYESTKLFVSELLLDCTCYGNQLGDYLNNNFNLVKCEACGRIQEPSLNKLIMHKEILDSLVNELQMKFPKMKM